ncbi:MAG: carbohydrate ABC transporter permease, partial [Anaerolineae bacterium]|nr:carbohydrate ABC transporter permease [Anaerolineae bacterium]
LEESAMIDGASRVTAFLRIVLPLSAPGLVAVAIFSFVFSWNEYLYALMLTNFEAITMPVLIAGQNNTRGIQWWFISALTLTAVAPVVVIGLLLERYITRGLVAGAIKG